MSKPLKGITFQISLLLGPTPAIAEVCNKYIPNWNPASGPVGPIEFIHNAIMSPLGILIISLFLSGPLLRKTWIALLASGSAIFLVFGIRWIWVDTDAIYASSILEGCRASPAWLLSIICLCTIAFLIVAGRRYLGG